LDMYTWRDAITDPFELMLQAQQEVTQWSFLLNATGGALKLEKCFWDNTCYEGEWSYAMHSDFELSVTNPGTPPQSKTFTELRTELFTIIYQHSPNVALAQV